jgi:hypothetical protein
MLEDEPLDEPAKELLLASAKELQEFLQKYGIKKEISYDQAEQILTHSPHLVFSTISSQNQMSYELTSGTASARVETQLCSGVHSHENTLSYFLSERPHQEKDDSWLDIEFVLNCQACMEEQLEFGEAECDACGRDDGNLMYALIWDQSGNVTIDRLDPEDF